MYTEAEQDDISVEEAYEAQEDSSSSSSSSSTASSSATTPTAANENLVFQSSLRLASHATEQEHSYSLPTSSGTARVHLEEIPSPSSSEPDTNDIDDSPRPTRRRRRTRVSHSESSNTEPAAGLLIAPVWVPDELVSSCTSCEQSFTLIRRRHHCRNCGQIYCRACSNQFIPLAHFGFEKPVRVCGPCFLQHCELSAVDQRLSASYS